MRLFLCLWFVLAAVTCGYCEITMSLDKIEVKFCNESYATDPLVDVSMDSKSAVINAKVKVIKDFDMNVKMVVQIYELVNGKYELFPMDVNLNVCEEIDKNSFFIKDLITTYSDGPGACPLKKGDYHLKNGIFDVSKLLSEVPSGSYKAVAKVYNGDDYVAELELLGSVKKD